MRIDILTLFPEMFQGPFEHSIIKRARDAGLVDLQLVQMRGFAEDRHRQMDDYPFGGGPGMVLKVDPVVRAVETVAGASGHVVLLSPQGTPFTQAAARRLSEYAHLVFLCGHYEAIDERVRELVVAEELSIGDYVLTGGELPCMVVVDAVVRLLPGALGAQYGTADESFQNGLLEYPQYTRPREFRGLEVPRVL
ncbi:tRNA (guanosine(37)-N1)-methyltransferase TrmD, partial [bacterium]|nr:tRNA (guanosine(37)-N1)-methyltransferase TrmD [candidate division CSSED10-310 bacterium]